MLKILREVQFSGKCPGGTYYDQMQKERDCPRKTITIPSSHALIAYQLNSENPNQKITLKCTRCGSEIEMKPQPTPVIVRIIDIEDFKES